MLDWKRFRPRMWRNHQEGTPPPAPPMPVHPVLYSDGAVQVYAVEAYDPTVSRAPLLLCANGHPIQSSSRQLLLRALRQSKAYTIIEDADDWENLTFRADGGTNGDGTAARGARLRGGDATTP
jgi:hypothetical protein